MTMAKRTLLREHLNDLKKSVTLTIEMLEEELSNDQQQECNRTDAMNIDKHSHPSPAVALSCPKDPLGGILPPLLTGRTELSTISKPALDKSLQPIIHALQDLDARVLLDLAPAEQGPLVRDGERVRPVYDEVRPPLHISGATKSHSCVRYLHIAEVPDQYSIGIFVFAPNARIPLHDHPGMCVLSRVLYGELQRTSLDLARDDEVDPNLISVANSNTAMDMRRPHWLTGFWGNNSGRPHSVRQTMPKGARYAFKNATDKLKAPEVSVLYPFEGNLHEFVAGPDGAAVLDVLLPPYDQGQHRDCTFYEIEDIEIPSFPKSSNVRNPCWIIPTGQPESFHCISGQYRDLGGGDN